MKTHQVLQAALRKARSAREALRTLHARTVSLSLLLATFAVAPELVLAQTSGLTGFEAAKTAAGTKNLSNVADNAGATTNSWFNAFMIGITAFGVVIVGLSLFQFWKASKEERETPKPAIVGVLVGGAMTVVGIITVYAANSATA